jgi:hypothetical protein
MKQRRRELRPKFLTPSPTLGPMLRKEMETAPSYIRILRAANFIDEEMQAPGAWAMWLKLNDDRVILAKKAKLPKLHMRVNTLNQYVETAHILEKMSASELSQLRTRLASKPADKYF